MSGILLVNRRVSFVRAIEEILIMAECSEPEEWEGIITYLSPEPTLAGTLGSLSFSLPSGCGTSLSLRPPAEALPGDRRWTRATGQLDRPVRRTPD